jgi:hypothetical protein
MRIPTSVIVMSLLTAAPFGLAIRDTLTKKQQPAFAEDEWGDYGRDHRSDSKALAEYEAEMQREADARAEKRKKQVEKLDQLYGQTKASMGTLLDGVFLGADAGNFQPEATRQRIEKETESGFLDVSFDADAKALRSVTIALSARDYDPDLGEVVNLCEPLHDKLVTAWGPSMSGTWLDEVRHVRATLDTDSCTLTWDQYLPVDEWLRAVTAVQIGKPAEKTLQAYSETAGIAFDDYNDETVRWYLPGLGAATGATEVTAMIQKGKIVGVRAIVEADFDSLVAIRDGLSTLAKAQPTRNEDDEENWYWKKKAMRLTQYEGSDRVFLLVGKDPWE